MAAKFDLKQIAQWKNAQIKHFQKLTRNWDTHFETYEQKVRQAVRSLDLKSQEARRLSEIRLKEVSEQIKRTRADVEQRVKSLLDEETQKLNVRLRGIYSYLIKVAQQDGVEQKQEAQGGTRTSAKAVRSSAKKKLASPPRNRKGGTKSVRKNRAKAVVSEPAVTSTAPSNAVPSESSALIH